MNSPPLLAFTEDPLALLRAWRVTDLERGQRNLELLASTGLTPDLFGLLVRQLSEQLPLLSDPDRVLNNLERYVSSVRNPLAFGGLCERDPDTLPTLLQLFAASESLSDFLVRDPEAFDLVRMTAGEPTPQLALWNDIVAEVTAATDERGQLAAIRRIKQRETLRIVYGDFVRRQSIAVVTRQISWLADALVEAALRCARRKFHHAATTSKLPELRELRFAVLALGKLGGEELNYSSDIDLIFVADAPHVEPARRLALQEHCERLARQVVKLLTEPTELGIAYRVDLRLRPRGPAGGMVSLATDLLHYYDLHGRTWERQAFIKARCIAGDSEWGTRWLARLEPWVYRRYLNRADITGIKALKRRIEQRAVREGAQERDVKTGRGGLRDIEFATQFLQLLNGGDLPELRERNTLAALQRLEQAGCLTTQEATLLTQNYEFLRRIEHRLQVMYDRQTHTIPDDEIDLQKLALRLGYTDNGDSPGQQFQREYRERTQLNHRILDHLLHSAFADDPEVAAETDLVLDPEPAAELVEQVLAPYHLHHAAEAYRSLLDLSQEKIPFLSTRRCRHFLAAIAPKLLAAVAATPQPEETLRSLCRVSDSLGGKGVLWELMLVHPPTLHLYVRLCAASPYLCDLLVTNPGMIDELLDSLLLDRLPGLATLRQMLADLCRGAEDIEPILHGFRSALHLRTGVRDILGKEQVTATHGALADIMEAILTRVVQWEYARLVEKHGVPTLAAGPKEGEPCELLLVALGKLGGREPNYHSDCDVLFLYEGEGTTLTSGRKTRTSITNLHFFGQLVQRVIKVLTRFGPQGRLYEIDLRLRPAGSAGPLALSLDDFQRYYQGHDVPLWERQMLCKARVVYGSELARLKTSHLVRQALLGSPWQPQWAREIQLMRARLEADASPRNLKRGAGGTMDVEFVVQMYQLRFGREHAGVLQPNTLAALAALAERRLIPADEAAAWTDAYLWLRRVESGLRLLNTTARHELPDDHDTLARLAFLLDMSVATLEAECWRHLAENRARFHQAIDREAPSLEPDNTRDVAEE